MRKTRIFKACKIKTPTTEKKRAKFHKFSECEKKDIEEEVKKIAGFLKFAKDGQGGKLLVALLHTICKRFPADLDSEDFVDCVMLDCPCNLKHTVSPFGFALLEQAEIIVGGPKAEPLQNLVHLEIANRKPLRKETLEYLENVTLRASRQKQKITCIEMIELMPCDEGEKEALLKLLETCKSWQIRSVHSSLDNFEFNVHSSLDNSEDNVHSSLDNSEDNFVALLQGLAKEAARGSIESVFINDKIIARCTVDELEKMCNITQNEWEIHCWSCGHSYADVTRPDKLQDEGWAKIVTLIKSIHSNKHAHDKKCQWM